MSSPPQRDLFRTKLCKFFDDSGDCPRGDRCTFAHGESQLRDAPPEYDRRRRSPRGLREDSPQKDHGEDRYRERFDRDYDRRPSEGFRGPRIGRRGEDRSRSPGPRGRTRSPSPLGSEKERDRNRSRERQRFDDAPRRDMRGLSPHSRDQGAKSPPGNDESPRRSLSPPPRKRSKLEQGSQKLEDPHKKRLHELARELRDLETELAKKTKAVEDAQNKLHELQEKVHESQTVCERQETKFKKYLPAVLHLYERLKEDTESDSSINAANMKAIGIAFKAFQLEVDDLEKQKLEDLLDLELSFYNSLKKIHAAKARLEDSLRKNAEAQMMEKRGAVPAYPSRWTTTTLSPPH
eukprot:CAMPEP_0196664124 /NCGR_PEP_ID=MMETSP1086-20130531/55778_1 /TAXON_ID=77921 /ORGANISM="Cyanoptyche  gloeocystis , Strain SAG4.97" /LENGTH=349 /DNA_ID=CAMNT_0042000273 /DNA_START=43 /DNA_END=1092 /DNA_ORIENTATION=+